MADPDLNRRDFLTGGFLKNFLRPVVDRVAEPIERMEKAIEQHNRPPVGGHRPMPLLRPPGAIAEEPFLAGCTKCGDCHSACPHQAIRNAGPRFREAAGTPMIDPHEQPCLACPDTPCITACKPQVLRRPGPDFPTMGTARIDRLSCLPHLGTTCSTCVERCPVPGAIRVTQGKPTIVPETCIGCGICHQVCPAPRNAVMMLPLSERPRVDAT